MKAEERHKKIEAYLLKAEFASLEELAQHVDASVSTVRRDVEELSKTGAIKRTHGGARLLNPQSNEFEFSWRDTLQLPEKEAIGRACATLLAPGQSVIIDSGTTVYHAARHLEPQVIQVITNSLPVANLFASNQRVEVMVSGGVIYPRLGVLVGPLAVKAFSGLHADIAIMGGGGITLEGVMNSHALLIDIQQAMIRAAEKVIFCLDHTKFGRRSVAQLCDLSAIDTVVTDSAAPADLVQALRQKGVRVVVAPPLEGEPPPPAPTIKREEPHLPPRRSRREEAQISTQEIPKPLKPPTPKKPHKKSAPESPTPDTDRMGWD